jgi:hypothetical protein
LSLPVRAASFAQWVDQCAPAAPASVLAAIAQISSHYDPLSVRLPDDQVHQKFETIDDAFKAVTRLANTGQGEVQIGLFGFERSFLSDRAIPIKTVFDPCRSIALMADYLDRAPSVKGQPDYYGALSGLHPDDPDFAGAVLTLLKKGSSSLNQAIIGGLDQSRSSPSSYRLTTVKSETVALQTDDPSSPRAKWDVYGRSTGRTVLIYSKTGDVP